MIELHQGPMRHVGRAAAVLVTLVAIVGLSLAIFNKDDEDVTTGARPNPSVEPCAGAFDNQLVSTSFKQATDNNVKGLTLDSTVRVGVSDSGFCLDTSTEFNEAGWRISTIFISASSVADRANGAAPVVFSREGNVETESLPLYAPIAGCVDIRGSIQAVRDEPDANNGAVYVTWTAEGQYGECDAVPNAAL